MPNRKRDSEGRFTSDSWTSAARNHPVASAAAAGVALRWFCDVLRFGWVFEIFLVATPGLEAPLCDEARRAGFTRVAGGSVGSTACGATSPDSAGSAASALSTVNFPDNVPEGLPPTESRRTKA